MYSRKRCAACGLDVNEQMTQCPRCGSDIFYPLQLCCPVCGNPVEEGVDRCDHCGTALAVTPQHDLWRQCPNCASPMHVSETVCRRCGWQATTAPKPTKPAQPPKKKTTAAWLWLLAVPVLIFALILLQIFLNLQNSAQNNMGQWPTTTVPATSSLPVWSIPEIPEPSSSHTPPTSEPTQPTTQMPTHPPTEPPSQPPLDTDPVPEELRDNLYLEAMNDGYCEELVGDVMITVIFLSDTVSSWDSDGMTAAKTQFNSDLTQLETDAKSYGAALDVEITYLESTISYPFDQEDKSALWAFSALDKHDLGAMFYDQSKLEKYYNVDNAPIVFVLNRQGRAYAMSATSGKPLEYAVLYSGETTAFRHELSHIFGARDFYFPQETVTAANKYLPGSIMMDSINGTVDPLTAFLIGWTDILEPNAEAFLRATNDLTEEYLLQSQEQDQLTGYGTKIYGNGDVYTGYMVFGVPNGFGELTTPDGYSYKGDWKDGKCHGTGTVVYVGGDTYTGDFVNGERHGKGTYTWANGNTYTGDWVAGVQTGKGTFTWNNGTIYTGDWVAGKRVGKGTITWTNGSYYTGDWANDMQNGKGVYYYAQYGTRYEGDFVNGKRHGWGTYYYADGTTYTGKWENDVRVD